VRFQNIGWGGIAVLFCLTLSTQLRANSTPFLILNRTSGLSASDPIQGPILAALNRAADQIQSTINNGFLSESSRQTFDNGLAAANASNVSSLIMDRGDTPSIFTIGVGGQIAAYYQGSLSHITTAATNSLPSVGVTGQANLMLGLRASALRIKRIGFLDPSRLMLYLNGFRFSTNVGNTSANVSGLGLNAQYLVIEPRRLGWIVGWGGISAGLGANYSSNSISYTASLNQTGTGSADGQSVTVNTQLDYNIGAKSTNVSIPLELSSYVSFLYVFTVYGGIAVDFNAGSSQLTGSATGPVTATYSGTIPGVSNLFSGTASLNLDDQIVGTPSLTVLRTFVGLELNASILKLSAEYVSLSNGAMSLAGLVRVAF
jgi:hypothetical protein